MGLSSNDNYRKICLSRFVPCSVPALDCLIDIYHLTTLISAKLSRQGWVAESSSFLNHSHYGVFPPSFGIDKTVTSTNKFQGFLSSVGRFDWLMIQFPAVVRDIVTVEVVKRINYLDRFKVMRPCKRPPIKCAHILGWIRPADWQTLTWKS